MRICAINHKQARVWEVTGERPNCDHHRHLSSTEALALVLSDAALALPSKQAIVIYDCVDRYSWTGARSGCFQVMQMKPIMR